MSNVKRSHCFRLRFTFAGKADFSESDVWCPNLKYAIWKGGTQKIPPRP